MGGEDVTKSQYRATACRKTWRAVVLLALNCDRDGPLAELVRRREHLKGGCIIGNLSTALADTHEAFRQRLADCFDEMGREFLPDLSVCQRQNAA